jgi:hypothetical protein
MRSCLLLAGVPTRHVTLTAERAIAIPACYMPPEAEQLAATIITFLALPPVCPP